jgi:hypothetical protein
MTTLQMNGLTMPANFPRLLFEKIYTVVQPHHANPVHPQFIGAWSAVSYRYKALAEYDERFTRSIKKGPSRTHEVRYQEERDLFGFTSNAYSVFDAFFYAMFAIGALIQPQTFVLLVARDERNVTFGNTKRLFSQAFPLDPIRVLFEDFDRDQARKDLSKIRNILTHRAAPPRKYGFALGQPKPAWAHITRLDVPLDKNTTKSLRAEVSRLLTVCLSGAAPFVASKLSPPPGMKRKSAGATP